MTLRCPGHWGSHEPLVSVTLGESWTPCVRDTGETIFFCLDFFPNLQAIPTDFKANNLLINWQNILFTVQIHLIQVSKKFLISLFLIDSTVSWTQWSHFRISIALWKIAKNKNGFWEPHIGPGGVVWWEKQLQKSHATFPLMLELNQEFFIGKQLHINFWLFRSKKNSKLCGYSQSPRNTTILAKYYNY